MASIFIHISKNMEGKRSRNMEGHINYILHIKEEYSIFGEACSADIPIVVTLSSGLQKGSMSFQVLEHDACGKRIVQSYSKPPRIAPSLQVSSKTKILATTKPHKFPAQTVSIHR
jgi:hypothetical protein